MKLLKAPSEDGACSELAPGTLESGGALTQNCNAELMQSHVSITVQSRDWTCLPCTQAMTFSMLDIMWLKRSRGVELGWRFSRLWPRHIFLKKLGFNSPANPRMPRFQPLVASDEECSDFPPLLADCCFNSFVLCRLPVLRCSPSIVAAKLVANRSLAILYTIGMLCGVVGGRPAALVRRLPHSALAGLHLQLLWWRGVWISFSLKIPKCMPWHVHLPMRLHGVSTFC